MRPATARILLGCALLLACALVAVWRWKTGALLRLQLAERTAPRPAVMVQPPVDLPAPPPFVDEAAARATRDEIAQLRQRIAALQAEVPWPTSVPQLPPPVGIPSSVRSTASFTDAGRSTPTKTIQTLFWAAGSGNLERIESLLLLDAEARTAATALFASLPPVIAAQHRSPEALLALLVTGDISFQSNIVSEQKASPDEATVHLAYLRQGEAKGAALRLRRDADGWRLLVPLAAVEKYTVQLKGAP